MNSFMLRSMIFMYCNCILNMKEDTCFVLLYEYVLKRFHYFVNQTYSFISRKKHRTWKFECFWFLSTSLLLLVSIWLCGRIFFVSYLSMLTVCQWYVILVSTYISRHFLYMLHRFLLNHVTFLFSVICFRITSLCRRIMG